MLPACLSTSGQVSSHSQCKIVCSCSVVYITSNVFFYTLFPAVFSVAIHIFAAGTLMVVLIDAVLIVGGKQENVATVRL